MSRHDALDSANPHGSRASALVPALMGLAMLLALAPSAADAQVLTGRVLDGATDAPLEDAAITLLHPDGHALADPVPSDADGRFTIELPGPGSYYIRADLIGYTSMVDGIFDFASADGRMDVAVYLLVQPVEIEGVDARVEQTQTRRNLRAAGFYERAASGFGDFISPEEIEERQVGFVSDYMRHVPGILRESGRVLFKNPHPIHGPYCEPWVWIDGVRIINGSTTRLGAGPGDGLDERVRPENVVAIEVYRRPSSTPLQWGGLNGRCGAIVIWTKAGR